MVRACSGWRCVGVLAVVAMACITMPGCVDAAALGRLRDDAAGLRETLARDVEDRRSAVVALAGAGVPEDDPARRTAQAGLDAAAARHATADAAVKQLDVVLREAADPTDPVSRGLSMMAEGLPEPARSPLILGGALVVTLLRARQLKSALVSVARSIEEVKESDEEFRKRFKDSAPTIRSIQTPAARRIIEGVTGDGFSLSLPI